MLHVLAVTCDKQDYVATVQGTHKKQQVLHEKVC